MILGLLLLSSCGGPRFHGNVRQPVQPAPDFSLIDQEGRTWRLSDHKGGVVVMYFGYTYCPDVCPTTLGDFKRIQTALGEKADEVWFVLITVDPERDTPERLGKYISFFSPHFVGLTGSVEDLTPVYEAYDIYVEKVYPEDSAADYLVNHTATVFLVDPEGNWRLVYEYGTPPDEIAEDIDDILNG